MVAASLERSYTISRFNVKLNIKILENSIFLYIFYKKVKLYKYIYILRSEEYYLAINH
jgi:hypothetical protein